MKQTVRRLCSLLFVITITASIALVSLAPLFTPTTVAQTNPQTTDIFTGQFIPAYFGAAYDPSEAFKQMAGLEVYVFSYDTWGTIVNNFAYKTQIKADGSFQAGGLPNASHYGVCFAVSDASLEYFRAPLPDDNIQSAFAYSQATLDLEKSINTQIADKPVNFSTLNGGEGCRVFLTSSRNADLANHINIFPLVPTNILSVIIKDAFSTPDFTNYNKPYEIYAQRITTGFRAATNDNASCTDAYYTDQARKATCLAGDDVASVTNGPVIRGRTVYYTPTAEDGSACGGATIFQAFAPKGDYAITYWRPDGRDAENQITYLNYNGTQPLNSPYNGVAFESVGKDQDAGTWRKLSTRCVLENTEGDAGEGSHNYWEASGYGASIWGLIRQGKSGYNLVNQLPTTVKIGNDNFKFVDIRKRACVEAAAESSSNQGEVPAGVGVYLFSSCNKRSASVGSYVRIVGEDDGSTGSVQTSKDPIVVTIGSQEGPTRKDIEVTTNPTTGMSGVIQLAGKPMPYAWLNLKVDNRTFKKFAQTDQNGRFYIGSSYFTSNPFSNYVVSLTDYPGSKAYRSFAIDASAVASKVNDGMFNLPLIALDKQADPVQSFLAKLSLPNVLSMLRVQPVFAESPNTTEGKDVWSVESDPFSRNQWVFYIDQNNLPKNVAFTPSSYKLKHAHIAIPDEWFDFINCVNSDDDQSQVVQECRAREEAALEAAGVSGTNGAQLLVIYAEDDKLFTINNGGKEGDDDDTDNGSGVLLGDGDGFEGVVTPSKDGWSENILAVSLEPADLDNIKDQLTYLTHVFGTVPLKLYIEFEYYLEFDEEQAKTTGNDAASSGQENKPPKVLSKEVLVNVSDAGDGNFKVSYDTIVLEQGEGSKCKSASIWDGVFSWVESGLCRMVQGSIGAIESAFGWIAGNILILNPLSFDAVPKYWNIIRNIVNSFSVLLLIFAGLAIMFRYEPKSFGLQSALTRLVVTIILVNFSILIVQVAVDVTNVIGFGGYKFLVDVVSDSGDNYTGQGILAAGASLSGLGTLALVAITTQVGGVGLVVGLLIFFLGILLFFLYVVARIMIDYLLRLATIWLCIIFAPAAFAARLLPSTQKYFARWKGLLIGALVAQVALAVVLAIAIGLLKFAPANGFGGAILTFLMAFILFYSATIVPRKAAAMAGEDLSSGLESSIKKGIALAGSKAKLAGANIYKTRQLGKARDIAFKEDIEHATAGKGTVGAWVAKQKFMAGKAASEKFSAESLVFGQTRDEASHLTEEAFGKALEEKQKKVKRDNMAAFDYQDEKEYADKLAEMETDKDKKIYAAANAGVDEGLREQKHLDELSAQRDEVRSQALRLTRPDLLDVQRQNASEDKRAETERRMKDLEVDQDYPHGRDNRLYQEEKKQDYVRSDSVLGAIIDGAKFTDAKMINPLTEGGYNIDLNFNGERLGDMTGAYGVGMRRQLEKVIANDARTGGTVADDLFNAISAANLETSDNVGDFYDHFTYTDPAGVSHASGAESWKAWHEAAGIKVGSEVTGSDLKGRVTTMLTTEAVKKSDNAGWMNNISRNATQVTGAGVPHDAMFNPLTTREIQAPFTSIGYEPLNATHLGAPMLDMASLPTFVSGKDHDQVQSAMVIIRRAYEQLRDTGTKMDSPDSVVPRNEYNRAIGILTRAGYKFTQ